VRNDTLPFHCLSGFISALATHMDGDGQKGEERKEGIINLKNKKMKSLWHVNGF